MVTPDWVVLEPLDALDVLLDELLELRQDVGLYQRRELELLVRLVVGIVNDPPRT